MTIKNHSRICLILSATIIAVALIMSLFGAGMNFGIDFSGGLNITYNMNQSFDQVDVETILNAQGITSFTIARSGTDGETLQIRVPELGGEEQIQSLQAALESGLKEKYPNMDVENGTANYVGPVAGASLLRNAVISVLLANLLILLYIAFRFDLSSGLAAIFGLLHDVLIMISFMVLLRNLIQVNSPFIAAVLTVVGFSINNTIIIFDRIRENNKKPEYSGSSRVEVVNLSVKECLGRTIITTFTMVSTLAVLYIMGVESIREFSLPIIIGILAGAYSANMINGYVWAFLEGRRREREKGKKLETKKA